MKCYSNKSLIQKYISFFYSSCVYDLAIVFIILFIILSTKVNKNNTTVRLSHTRL